MLYYDTPFRIQIAREQADRLASEMRRSRHLTPEEIGYPAGLGRLGSALAGGIERLRRRRGYQTPAFDA
jgi:hypothetical protein